MCAITLTVLQTCKHELPTIDYCSEIAARLKKFNKKRSLGVDAAPPETCTDSLGWTIFKRIEAPVECEGCKMWLFMNGKTTYRSLMKGGGEVMSQENVTAASDSSGDQNVEVGEDTKDIENDVATKVAKEDEMLKLQSKLSRIAGVSGRVPKRGW